MSAPGRSVTLESERERVDGRQSQFEPLRTVGLLESRHSVAATNAKPANNPEQLCYWITSSARSSSDCGIVRPSALAVLRLITSSNLVGCSMGKSPGFAPLRILST